MVVVLALAGLAVLGAVVVLAMGRGGELAAAHPDRPPLPAGDAQLVGALEAGRLRLPRGLWGYQSEIADDVVYRLVHLVAEREARVAELEWRLADLGGRPSAPAEPGPPSRAGGDGARPFEDELFAEHEAEVGLPAETAHGQEAESATEPERRRDARPNGDGPGRGGNRPAGEAQPVGLVKGRQGGDESEEH